MKLKRTTDNLRDQQQNDDEVYAETIEAVLVHKQAIKFSNSIPSILPFSIVIRISEKLFNNLTYQCYPL